MIAILQRVKRAEVSIKSTTIAHTNNGYLILLGIEKGDIEEDIDKLIKKIPSLRVFEDNEAKMNLSLTDISGEILVVPNFTLLADCKKGRRPSFCNAENPDQANKLFEMFCDKLKISGVDVVKRGIFGADMQVSLENDGPVTLILNSKQL